MLRGCLAEVFLGFFFGAIWADECLFYHITNLPKICLVFMSTYTHHPSCRTKETYTHSIILSLPSLDSKLNIGTLAHPNKKAFKLLPYLPRLVSKTHPRSFLISPLPKKNEIMEFRTLHLNSKPSLNGEGSIWNYVSTPTTLLPGETLPCEDVPAFSNAEQTLWMEAKRVCEIDPNFQGWYVNIHSLQYIKSCGAGWRGLGGEGRR